MLTLQYIPFNQIQDMDSDKRINMLIKAVKANKIVLMEGRLRSSEEAELIKRTMEEIDKNFRGIELSVIDTARDDIRFFRKLKSHLANLLLGDRNGLTIIGPAKIIKEIKHDPDKIQLLTKEVKTSRKR